MKENFTRKEVIRLCSKAWLKNSNPENMLENFDKWVEKNVK
jgi:hypothetical protein